MTFTVGNTRVELLQRDEEFIGLGKVWIGDTLVRSGRLPLTVTTQSFKGHELAGLRLIGVDESEDELRIRLEAAFRPLPVKLMRDHSFDPIHDTGDWDAVAETGTGELDIVIRPAADAFNGVEFAGFSYHYEYRSTAVPLFYLYDKASWELGGDIAGASVYNQSSCSNPVVTFKPETFWTTEGTLFFVTLADDQNPVMTHNLPRWASHQAFDFQFKADQTLIGVFDRVELIRSVLRRDARKPELKCFDKHLFDEAKTVKTAAKKILLNTTAKSKTAKQNQWTWISEEVDHRARAEFGLRREPTMICLSHNFWRNFTTENYFDDLVPAAIATGIKLIFVDNLKKSAMTEQSPLPGVFNWNMCCGHEYEISDKLGGNEGVKRLVDACAEHGIQVMSWTNNDQALSSPVNDSERDEKGWYVLLDDTRQKYGGAYAAVMSVLDLGVEGARRYFVDTHKKIAAETGLNAYLFDSFYNLGFMPISYRDCKPRTIWRGLLQTVKELQDADVHFNIESFGPFGQPMHGHPSSYNFENIFICFRVGLGNDYSTVPTRLPTKDIDPRQAEGVYYALAHMACTSVPLFRDGQRVDTWWILEHRQALDDYHACLDDMHTRYLQEDGQAVIWHNRAGDIATLWNFIDREATLPGCVKDVTDGRELAPAERYALKASHTYRINASVLPKRLG